MLYGTYLAFDFGLSRTGVATGNSVTRSAEPRGILFAQTNAERWAAIEALVEHWEPVAFVVGVPRHPDGAPGELTGRCERFARQLGGRFRRPVFTVDERYSSVEVEHEAEWIDDLSACVILEQYFAENASSETEA